MTNNYRRGRDAEYQAREILRREGFEVIRSSGSHTIWDLVAWHGDGRILLIQVKRTGGATVTAATISLRFKEAIDQLRRTPGIPGGVPQIWIRSRRGWHRYEILPGGVAEVPI